MPRRVYTLLAARNCQSPFSSLVSPQPRNLVSGSNFITHQKPQAMIDTSTFALLGEIAVFVGISPFISLIIIKALSDIAKRPQLPKNRIRDTNSGVLTLWLALAAAARSLASAR